MRRLWIVFGFISLFYSIIIVRLFYWQIIRGEQLHTQALAQYSLSHIIPASRGSILTSDESPLVLNQQASLVYAEPHEIMDIAKFTKDISGVLSLDYKQVLDQLSVPGRAWVPLAHKVDEKNVALLKSLKLKGMGFESEPKRYYPEATMAANVLGFVGSDDNGFDKGYFGLEGYYDRALRGKDGLVELERDVKGTPILLGSSKRIEPENGRHLRLWLDRTVQFIVERRLSEGIRNYGAKEGSVIVIDPKTGGILAMAVTPSYNPLLYTAFDKELYKNPIVASSYEPGSTFKVLVMSAALQEKKVTPDTIVDESGPLHIGEYSIQTWNNQYRGSISMTQVLEKSSNVGMVRVGQKLGKDALLKYIRAFGFGHPTNVDLQEETSPELRDNKNWTEIDLATATFGQGIAVTPLQMGMAVAAIANKGWLMEPKVVREIVDDRGNVTGVKPKRIRQVIDQSAAKIITEMMVAAVDNGEAKWAKPNRAPFGSIRKKPRPMSFISTGSTSTIGT